MNDQRYHKRPDNHWLKANRRRRRAEAWANALGIMGVLLAALVFLLIALLAK